MGPFVTYGMSERDLKHAGQGRSGVQGPLQRKVSRMDSDWEDAFVSVAAKSRFRSGNRPHGS